MSLPLPKLQVGQPLQAQSMTVFPLFAEGSPSLDYLLADDALSAATVTVEETSDAGSVPELIVDNLTDARVLFLEGQELRGAKQNRVLNTSVLVPAKSKTKIPVSCVEQGRWRYSSKTFSPSDTMSSASLRYKLKSSVTMSLKRAEGHRSDQGSVWSEVDRQQKSLGVSSPTMAMSDTYANYGKQIAEVCKQVRYLQGSCGIAVALGSRVVSLDYFDKPETCQKVWERLVSGYALEVMEQTTAETPPDTSGIEALLQETTQASWQETPAVGDGQELRAEFPGHVGSALLYDGTMVHLSVLAAR